MARGLSREQSREKAQKKQAQTGKGGKDDNLTPQQRAERDAARMAEKKAAKENAKSTGAITPEQQAEEEKRKAKAKQKQAEARAADKSRVHKK